MAVTKEIRNKIREFGAKGETYTEILAKLYKSAKERQLHDLLLDKSDSVSVDSAFNRAKKRWQ